ncbi:auxin response factor 8-like [Cornus florida]|uniref:auxin response factor 8-like n=1 Tax=Cornus florida TaxID=4283 RepID=UPI00289878DB|nr:auxin response factor 8-like [Cornus florida]
MTEPVVNPQEWFACAGRMAQVPSVGSKVFYYPQGHAEHVCALDRAIEGVPTMICCRVLAVRFHANSVTDEVYAALELVRCDESEVENTNINAAHVQEGPLSVRVLTSSDISDSLSVLDDCVENIFPRINSPYNHGSQVISAKDIHGTIWWFQHMQMLNRRVNILSQGWKMYVALKKLVAGDVHVFMKVKDADPFIGIAKKVWRYERAAPTTRVMLNATRGDPFVVRYYPRASSPQFFVDMSVVRKAMRFQWQPNMKFQK